MAQSGLAQKILEPGPALPERGFESLERGSESLECDPEILECNPEVLELGPEFLERGPGFLELRLELHDARLLTSTVNYYCTTGNTTKLLTSSSCMSSRHIRELESWF